MPPKAADMRSELRALRKEALKPISKMRMGDISAEIEKLKVGREETPSAAATPSGPVRKLKSAAESIKAAKASEFPVMPSEAKKSVEHKPKKSAGSSKAEPEKKKSSKVERLLKMMEDMSDSD